MTNTTSFRTVQLTCLTLGMSAAIGLGQISGDPVDITLLPVQFALTRLAPGTPTAAASFTVDVANPSGLLFKIRSSGPLVQTWIQRESQPPVQVRPDNIATFGGSYTHFDSSDPGLFIPPVTTAVWQYYYDLLSLGPGVYTVQLDAGLAIAGEIAVMTELIMESPVAVTLLAVNPDVTTNEKVVLTAAVFEGANAVQGANVPVTIISPAGAISTITLLDRGEFPKGDEKAGDGLYSGFFTPEEYGEYTAHASITGHRSNGVAFQRDAGTSVRVSYPCGEVTGFLADYGQDDNDNGRYEWLVIEAEANVYNGGEYILQAGLETASGKILQAYGSSLQSLGVRKIKSRVSSNDIQAAGEPGPYRILWVSLSCVGVEGAASAGRFYANTNTHPYRLAQFEPSPPPDCNHNGSADPVEIAYGLAPDCNQNTVPDECDIEFCFGFPECADCNHNGIPDGCEADCNGNHVADACDITAGTSIDCDLNGIPDECPCPSCPCPIGLISSTVAASPPNLTRDARQPHPLNDNSLAARQGIGSAAEPISITLTTCGNIKPTCFQLCEMGIEPVKAGTGTPPLSANQIVSVTKRASPPKTYDIVLARPISAGYWTSIKYWWGNTKVSYASLPADVNVNNVSNAADVTFLNSCLATPSLCGTNYRRDIDRSGIFDNADETRVSQLLSGAGTFLEWQGWTLNSNTCFQGGGGPYCPSLPCGGGWDPQAMSMAGGFGGMESFGEESLLEDSEEPYLDENAQFANAFASFLTESNPVSADELTMFQVYVNEMTEWCLAHFSAEEKVPFAEWLADPARIFACEAGQNAAVEVVQALAP